MIQTISLHSMLRETLTPPSRHLVTRPTGRLVRGGIEQRMAASGCVVAVLDFAEVELLDMSCADEVVAKLLLAGAQGCHVVLCGLRSDQLEAVDHVLRHHRLAVVALAADAVAPAVVGWADDDTRAAFAAVASHGPLTADGLARVLGWARDRALRALDTLALQRLVRPVADAFHPLALA